MPDQDLPQIELHIHLRAWRRSKRLTQEALGAIIGSKPSTISGWEAGDRQVGLDDLKRLAAAYKCHPSALLFAPDLAPEVDRMRAANDILAGMTKEEADEWLSIGRRIARSEKTAS